MIALCAVRNRTKYRTVKPVPPPRFPLLAGMFWGFVLEVAMVALGVWAWGWVSP